MDRLIHTALSGLMLRTRAQAHIADAASNLATPGFRAQLAIEGSAYLDGAGAAGRAAAMRPGAMLVASGGAVVRTGRSIDVAPIADAWLAVRMADGREGVTRRGDLSLGADGSLVNGAGQQLLGRDGPVRLVGVRDVSIADDGTISSTAGGGEPVALDRLRLVTVPITALRADPDGLLVADGAEADPQARLIPGALESSNAEPARLLATLIDTSRGFEAAARLLATARELDERSAALLRLDA